MISQETIDKVEEKAEIVAVVSDYLSLKKRGTTWEAPCPFHGEKTASFKVSQSKGIYKCFGCGKGGNAVRFIMEHEKYSYPEAIKHLAKKYNIEFIELEVDEKQREADMARDSIYTINEFASEKFSDNILREPTVMAYVKERGLTDGTIKKFGIGWSTGGYRDLYDYLLKNKYAPDTTVTANLATVGEESKKTIDKFRDRLMFPIHNITGRIVGFGGRTLSKDKSIAKYVNTADTPVYLKRNIVYGLYFAKKAIVDLDNCFLVEGYLDVISPVQRGIENICAVSGTSLTIEQIKLIRRFTHNITILYDGDKAGLLAAARSMEVAIAERMNIKVVLFEKDMDPDTFVVSHGSQKFKEYVEANKMDIIDFYFRDWKELNPAERDERSKVILRLIAKIPSDETFTIKNHTEKMARLFNLDVRFVNHQLQQIKRGQEVNESLSELILPPTVSNHETEFIKALIMYGNETYNQDYKCYWHMIKNCGLPEKFKTDLAREILETYIGELQNNHIPDLQFFIDHPKAKIAEFAAELEFQQATVSQQWENNCGRIPRPTAITVTQNVTAFLRIYKFKEMISDISEKLRITNDDAEIEKLFTEDQYFKNQLSIECRMMGINLV